MDNIANVLEEFGSSMDDVVKCTVFLAEMSEWGAMNDLGRYASFLGFFWSLLNPLLLLAVYAVDGSFVRTLVDGSLERGRHHTVTWDGRDSMDQQVASGVYFYRLAHEDGTEARSMVLMK